MDEIIKDMTGSETSSQASGARSRTSQFEGYSFGLKKYYIASEVGDSPTIQH
jgi:hypothetical protein